MTSQSLPKVVVGVISYKDKAYLEQGIPSLLDQDYENYEVIVCDNSPEQEVLPWLKERFSDVRLTSKGGNVGFGRGHNHMMQIAIQEKADYYLCFNSDMFASRSYISELVKYYQDFEKKYPGKKLGCLTPKLLEWKNFPKSPLEIKENTYDTTGIIAMVGNRFSERGFGELDKGQYDDKPEIWGACGASPMFSLEVLKDIQHSEGEYFDEGFFMYKEDIDLSYRIRWAGYEIHYTANSVAWHDRTGADPGSFIKQIKERRKRPAYIKENSFLNQLQTVYKNWSNDFSLNMKFKTCLNTLKYFAFLGLFDWKTLSKYSDFKNLKPALKEKRNRMPRRISAKEMERLFNLN